MRKKCVEVTMPSKSKWKKKSEQAEKSTTFLGSIREGKIQGKPLLLRWEKQTGEFRESWLS